MIKQIYSNDTGDTIIEVLISLVIMALIITGAYITSNDSLSNIVAARERVQALGIAQSQVEDLRAEAATIFTGLNATYINTPYPKFCFGIISGVLTLKPSSDPSCVVSGYTTKIKDLGPTDSVASDHITTHTFKISTNWDSASKNIKISGGGQLILYYRVTP